MHKVTKGGSFSSSDVKVKLNNSYIKSDTFTSDINLTFDPINGTVTFPAGTKLNCDVLDSAAFNSIRAVVSYKAYDNTQKKSDTEDKMQFKNESKLEFTDISYELYRIYEFSNGKTIHIMQPLKLSISKSGGHRIFDGDGISHYIPQGWVRVSWKAKPGSPNFIK